MNKPSKIWITILRIAIGWLFFYAGIVKVLDPEWSAAGYLEGANTFSGLFEWFASPANIGWVNLLNEWGLTLIGLALIFGLFVRYFSSLGMLMMLLYYIPVLEFPYVGDHSFLVNEHIIYLLVLCALWALDAGRFWGLDRVMGDYGGDDTMEEHIQVDY